MDEELKKLLILSTQSIKGLTDSLTKKESVGEANIKAAVDEGSKIWEMSLEGVNVYCNPSVENLAREVFLSMEILFESYEDLNIHEIKLNETPKCYTICNSNSITDIEKTTFKKFSP